MFQLARKDAHGVEVWKSFNDLLDFAFNRFEICNVDLLQLAAAGIETLCWICLEGLKFLEFRFQSFQTLRSATRRNHLLTLSMKASRKGFSEPRCSPKDQNCLKVRGHCVVL